jgi:hypothetical protein
VIGKAIGQRMSLVGLAIDHTHTRKGFTMNEYILESAAIYVNAYRNSLHYIDDKKSNDTLRNHVAKKFGAVYAAILIK